MPTLTETLKLKKIRDEWKIKKEKGADIKVLMRQVRFANEKDTFILTITEEKDEHILNYLKGTDLKEMAELTLEVKAGKQKTVDDFKKEKVKT